MKRNFFLATLLILTSLIFCACNIDIEHNLGINRVEDKSEKTQSAEGIKGLVVSVPVGSIKVNVWDKTEIYVKAVKINSSSGDNQELLNKLKEIELTYNQEGDNYAVRAVFPELNINSLSVDLEISVPKSLAVYNIDSQVGDVELSGLNGQINTSGSVGKVQIDECSGTMTLRTATGDITVRNSSLKGDCSFTNNAGRVLFDGTIDSQGTYRMTTNAGKVDITLPKDEAFNLNASTNVGSIDCGFKVSGESRNTNIQGQVNGGGPKLILVNNVGSVSINKR